MTRCSIIVAYAYLDELSPARLACLAPFETERADQFKAPHRRREFLCARVLLRAILERYTGHPAASHKLTVDARGKPICVDGPAVSIAHSGEIVVCAATDKGQIGVDIEMPGRRRNVAGIANNYFAADEAAWLATQAEDRFYMLWVLKEAWLKAKGTGIAGGLGQLCCFVTPPDIEARMSDDPLPVLSLHTIDDAFVGLATTTVPHEAVIISCWDPLSGEFDENSGAQLVATTGPGTV